MTTKNKYCKKCGKCIADKKKRESSYKELFNTGCEFAKVNEKVRSKKGYYKR